ncbi:MAG: hemolysin family protein [Prevotellaceae bacterium]|jgi:CBS domain containing-hemolysin-like protein|nr:hemolysin family protein [Prevotellaceae bacterium]
MTDTVIYIVITVLFSAFFSGIEIAFVSVNKMRFEMENKGGLTARILSYFYKNTNHFISTLLVGNNIALVVYGIWMGNVIQEHLLSGLITNPFLLMLVQTIISTVIILVMGEFLPKMLFSLNPGLALRTAAIPLYILYILLLPISYLASGMSSLLLRLVGIKVNKEASKRVFTRLDLDYFVQSGIEHSANKDDIDTEVDIFQNALKFNTIKVRDCIIPRTEMVAVDVHATIEELKAKFVESGLSKIVVYDDNIDNIIGYIHSSEMFRHPDDWTQCVKQVVIIPETMPAMKLMKTLMQQSRSIAIVVDEFGGTAGLITLEDLVEEIFGDIEDEHDSISYVCKRVEGSSNEYILSGRLEIEKVNETFELHLPESDEYMTINGLILQQYQRFPKLHDTVSIDKYHFKILKVTATKIELVRLTVDE